jgi:hypothetical protein
MMTNGNWGLSRVRYIKRRVSSDSVGPGSSSSLPSDSPRQVQVDVGNGWNPGSHVGTLKAPEHSGRTSAIYALDSASSAFLREASLDLASRPSVVNGGGCGGGGGSRRLWVHVESVMSLIVQLCGIVESRRVLCTDQARACLSLMA